MASADKKSAREVTDSHVPTSQQRTVNYSRFLVALIILAVGIGLVYSRGGFWPLRYSTTLPEPRPSVPPYPEAEDDSNLGIPPYPRPHPVKRYSLEYEGVACWQHKGVWIADLSPVEMAYLDINRFQDTERSRNQTDEDKFCTQLRVHGASFWSLPPRWPENTIWCETVTACVKPDINVQLYTGFTESGGVWVLDRSTPQNQDQDQDRTRNYGLENALTMRERCNVLQAMGATYCESIQACPEFANILQRDIKKELLAIYWARIDKGYDLDDSYW